MESSSGLSVVIRARNEASAALKEVQREAEKAGQEINGTSQRGSAAMGMLKGAIANIPAVLLTVATAAATAGAAIGIIGIKSASELQVASQSMRVLVGNTDEANKLFGQLAKYANNTPFEFTQVAQAGKTLLAFGVESEKVYDRVRNLGDIAAVSGADFKALSTVFGQVTGAGRLQAENFNQLVDMGVPIGRMLESVGIKSTDLRDIWEKGGVSLEKFNEAFTKAGQEGGIAFQGTDLLAQTLDGRISTLKDTVADFARQLVGVKVTAEGLVIDPNGLFALFANAVEKGTGYLSNLATVVAPQFQAAFTGVLAMVSDVVKWFQQASQTQAFKDAVTGIANAWNDMAQVYATQVAPALAEFIERYGPLIGALIIGTVVVAIRLFIAFLSNLGREIKDTADELNRWYDTTKSVIDGAVNAWNFVTSAIGAAVQAIGGWINGTLIPIISAITAPLRFLQTIFNIVFSAALEIVSTVINTINQIILVVLYAAFTRARDIMNNILEAIRGPLTTARAVVSEIINGIRDRIQGGLNQANQIVANVMNALGLNIRRPVQDAQGAVNGLVGGFVTAGRNIAQGIVNGISNGAGAIVQKVKDICASALGAVKAFFGIRSPSKVMAEMGGYLMSGFANGIGGGSGMAVDAITTASRDLSDAFRVDGAVGVGSSYSGAVSPTVEAATVTPIATTSTPAATGSKVEINFSVGHYFGTDAEARSLAVQLSKLVQQAMQAQGVNDINLVRA